MWSKLAVPHLKEAVLRIGAWLFFVVILFSFNLVTGLLDAGTGAFDGDVIANILGFNPADVAGWAAFGVGKSIITETLARWVFFDYSILNQPETQLIRVGFIVILGGAFVLALAITLGNSILNLFRS